MSGVGMGVSWEMDWGTFLYEVRHRSVALNVGVGGGGRFCPLNDIGSI